MSSSIKNAIKSLFPAGAREKLLPVYHWFRAIVAVTRYGFPTHGMTVIGVTGTNGKTTTTNMIGKILTEAGYKTGIFSSAVVQIGADWQDSAMKLTTEDVFVLNKKFREMKKAGVTHLALEVSSHAIAQHRIWGIHFAGAVFTNLSQDHLDYHHSMDEYAAVKRRLIKKAYDFVVINQDDERFEFMNIRKPEMTLTYGRKFGADVRITGEDIKATGASATLMASNQRVAIDLHLTGEFNLYNAAAAFGACHMLGLKTQQIQAGLSALQSVPGRMESIKEGQSYHLIVDHAHTPDAVENLLRALRKTTPGQLIMILGADGERDPGKREPLGDLARDIADFTVLTDQEPYGDDPEPIRQDLLKGLAKAGNTNYVEIPDRRKAVAHACGMAKKGDTVVLAGLGNQKYRGMKEGKVRWDDREVARQEIIKGLGDRG